jgi:peptidoglycan/LPS O-acetylase OafA/YrhL
MSLDHCASGTWLPRSATQAPSPGRVQPGRTVTVDREESVVAGPAARPSYRPQIDGIRALAVASVVAFHLGADWLPGGFIGVDIFFVLSGYLISGLLIVEVERRGRVSLSRFYARRARRLLPAAWVVIAFAVVVGRATSQPLEYENLRRHAASAAMYFANWDWASVEHGYFATDREPSPLIHFWSLAVEEQFYFLWPALVLACALLARQLSRSLLGFLAVAFGLVAGASIAFSVTGSHAGGGYYGTHTRAFELAGGGLLAVAMHARSRRQARQPRSIRVRLHAVALSALGLAGTAWLLITITGSSGYPGWWGVSVTASAMLLIAGVDLADDTVPAKIAGSAVPRWLGKLSYSVYLWHWPLIVFLGDVTSTPVLIALIVAAAALSYFVVEEPIRRRVFPQVASGKVVLVGLAGSLALGLLAIPTILHNTAGEHAAIAARHDVARPPGGCSYGFRTWPSPENSDACLLHAGSGPTVLLVGDSHAEMWAPAVTSLAEKYDWRLLGLARAKCTPSDFTVARSWDQHDPAIGDVCTLWRHVVYPKVMATYEPSFVIVGSRSQLYNISADSGVVGRRDPAYMSLWTAAWKRTLETFEAGGAEVLVLEPVPTLPASMLSCVAHESADCAYPASDDWLTARATAALARLVAADDRAAMVPVADLICPDGICRGRVDGTIVHQDTSHVTATFAARQAAALGRLLQAAGLGRSGTGRTP